MKKQVQTQIALSDIPSKFSLPKNAVSEQRADELSTTFYKLQNRLEKLLPLEKAFEEQLRLKLEDMRAAVADGSFPRIDMSFLGMRRQQEVTFPPRQKWSPARSTWVEEGEQNTYSTLVPQFAVFTPNTDSCTITAKIKYDYWSYGGGPFMKFDISGMLLEGVFHSEVNERMNAGSLLQLQDQCLTMRKARFCVKLSEDLGKVKKRLNKDTLQFLHALMLEVDYLHEHHEHRMSSICEPEFTFSTQFTGVLPDAILDKLPKWQQLFHEVYFVAEAADWAVSSPPLPQFNADPLVIGRINFDYWLLDQFDLTSAEEYVSREWTSK